MHFGTRRCARRLWLNGLGVAARCHMHCHVLLQPLGRATSLLSRPAAGMLHQRAPGPLAKMHLAATELQAQVGPPNAFHLGWRMGDLAGGSALVLISESRVGRVAVSKTRRTVLPILCMMVRGSDQKSRETSGTARRPCLVPAVGEPWYCLEALGKSLRPQGGLHHS